MNIWHNINPKRINPKDFIAIIELKKVVNANMS